MGRRIYNAANWRFISENGTSVEDPGLFANYKIYLFIYLFIYLETSILQLKKRKINDKTKHTKDNIELDEGLANRKAQRLKLHFLSKCGGKGLVRSTSFIWDIEWLSYFAH